MSTIPTTAKRARPPRSAWLALVCLVLFLLLAWVVASQGAVGFDESLIRLVQDSPVPTGVWQLFTDLGGPILAVIGTALVILLVVLRRIREAVVFALAIIGASLWTTFVKVAIARPRPPGITLTEFSGYSFPSGHTLNSTVTYGLIALVAWRTGWPRWMRVAIVIGLSVLVVLIGCSRIALGVHYPSDVLGGWLAGIGIVAAAAALTPPGRISHIEG
jgi:membrane-associated phospholipid phosphatase